MADEMKSPKDKVQSTNDLGVGSTPVRKMNRGKGACKGNGEEPNQRGWKRTRKLGSHRSQGKLLFQERIGIFKMSRIAER